MPLTKEQKVQMAITLGKAEEAIKDVTIDIKDARRAGLDVAEQEKELNVLRKTIRGIKNVYKPF